MIDAAVWLQWLIHYNFSLTQIEALFKLLRIAKMFRGDWLFPLAILIQAGQMPVQSRQ
jgi:hypothetical protein